MFAKKVKAANKAYSKMHNSFEEIKMGALEFRSSVSRVLQSGLERVLTIVRKSVSTVEGDFTDDRRAQAVAITSEMR